MYEHKAESVIMMSEPVNIGCHSSSSSAAALNFTVPVTSETCDWDLLHHLASSMFSPNLLI